jgi:hypothetical protein
MTHEAPMTDPEALTDMPRLADLANPLENKYGIPLPEGFVSYMKPEVGTTEGDGVYLHPVIDTTPVPGQSTEERTATALRVVDLAYNKVVPRIGAKLINDTTNSPLEIVAQDEHGVPILLRLGRDKDGEYTYRVSTDADGRIKRPMLVPPMTDKLRPNTTKKAQKIEEHTSHAAEKRNNSYLLASQQILALLPFISADRLGFTTNKQATPAKNGRPAQPAVLGTVSIAQFNVQGEMVRPDSKNPLLRTFNQLRDDEKLRLFVLLDPAKSEKKVALRALKIIEKSMRKGELYQSEIDHHVHEEHHSGHTAEFHHETPLEEADRLVAEMETMVAPELAPERRGLTPAQAAEPKFDAYGNNAPPTTDPAILGILRSYNDLTTLEKIRLIPSSGLTADENDRLNQTYGSLYRLTSEADRLRDEANRATTTHSAPTKRKRRLWGR